MMSTNNVLHAKISNKISKHILTVYILYTLLVLAFVVIGFFVRGSAFIAWYGLTFKFTDWNVATGELRGIYYYPENIVWFVLILLMFILLPVIHILVNFRRRKLTELSVSNTEVVGSYTAFIPISKITLRMPIEKIDNISAANSFFFLFTGKAVRIGSTSSKISIPFVENADEIVAFISEAIEKARKEQIKPVMQHNKSAQSDYAGSIRKLSELRDAGIITEEEFNQKKAELLGKI